MILSKKKRILLFFISKFAGNKVTLKPGFKVELGGTLKIDMNGCGE